MVNLLFCSGKFFTLRKGIVNLPAAIFSVVLVSLVSGSMFFGHNIYNSVMAKISTVKVARQLAANETDRIRAVSYDDVLKEELAKIDSTGSFYREIVLGKEYREDIGNTVMKHKPVTVNIYGSPDSLFPLVSVKTEKVSRWYKSGSFDKSDGGIYDETGEQHKGTIRKTGNGTGYVFLKKGAQVNGDVEIYDETNGDVYIYNSIGTPSGKTVIRHIGPSTSSGYIRLTESCSVSGTVTLENSSNGGMIIETALKNGSKISKLGTGTGYLRLADGCTIGTNVSITNNSAGAIIINKILSNNSHLSRIGSSDSLLVMNGTINGSIKIQMDNSGKLTLKGTFNNGNNINYSSKTNKSLSLQGNDLSGNNYFVNDSMANVEFYGVMKDQGKFIVGGTGNGKIYMGSELKGTAYVVNNTNGYIKIECKPIPDMAVIKKLGLGDGHLCLNYNAVLKGSFTYECDGSGFMEAYSYPDYVLNTPRYPVFSDGVYIKVLGPFSNEIRFAGGSQVLGRVIIDTTNAPNRFYGFGRNSGEKDIILQDGYIYKG